MQTRSGMCYSTHEAIVSGRKRKMPQIINIEDGYRCCRRRLSFDFSDKLRFGSHDPSVSGRKRKRPQPMARAQSKDRRIRRRLLSFDFFEELPEDMVLTILGRLSTTATGPADLLNVRMTCKRLNTLATDSMVLSQASPLAVAVRAMDWSENANKFLEQCASSGSREARYMLGMIRFYCLQQRAAGARMMAKAAMDSHAAAVYSLGVIQFNGSGGSKTRKDLRAGVILCARAASLGHIDAMRELAHCLQDGYGVRQNVNEGRRLLIQANARELVASSSSSLPLPLCRHHHPPAACTGGGVTKGCLLLSDMRYNVLPSKPHPANQFLVDWFNRPMESSGSESSTCVGNGAARGDELRLCSHRGCGRPETRKHEFRRCSVCGVVNYCSRACQAIDWKIRHKGECVPMEQWMLNLELAGGAVNQGFVAAVAAEGGGAANQALLVADVDADGGGGDGAVAMAPAQEEVVG